MRESLGTTWTMGLMIGFIFLFTSFLLIAMNFTKVYKQKNEVTSIVEKYEGITNSSSGIKGYGSVQLINNYLVTSGYSATGYCPTDDNDPWFGMSELNVNGNIVLEKSSSKTKYFYCIQRKKVEDTSYTYFNIKLFLEFDLPLIGNITAFDVNGATNDIVRSYCSGFGNDGHGFIDSSTLRCK